jgi:hypothetical protein
MDIKFTIMKRLVFIASVMMLPLMAYAQREVGTLSFQPKAGLSVAYYTGDDGVDTKPRFGIVAGAEFEYQLMKELSLSAGMLYSQQGEKGKIKEPFQEVDLTAKTDYLNFPILVNVYVAKGFSVKFGVQPAVNVKAGYSVSNSSFEWEGNLSYYGIHVKTFDLAIPVGLSYELKNFVIDARYNIGVTKMAEGDESRNRTFQFTIGYKKVL